MEKFPTDKQVIINKIKELMKNNILRDLKNLTDVNIPKRELSNIYCNMQKILHLIHNFQFYIGNYNSSFLFLI